MFFCKYVFELGPASQGFEIYLITFLFSFPDNSPKTFLFIIAFLLPCLAIAVCYSRIFYIVRKTALRTHNPVILNSGSMKVPIKKTEVKEIVPVDKIKPNNKISTKANKTNEKDVLLGNGEDAYINNQNDENNKKDDQNNSELSYSLSRNNSVIRPKRYLNKFDDFKFIDTSIDSESPPSLPGDKTNATATITTTNSNTNKIVEFANQSDFQLQEKQFSIPEHRIEVDSAVEDSLSSVDNFNVRFYNFV